MAATKQQIEQGKLRAGGNNPVKVTKAGVKRLGQAALIAASFTPIGRTAKVAGIIAKPISKVIQARSVKNTKVVVEKIAKMQEKAKAEKIASNSVKLKPAAKPVGNPVNQEKSIESMISSVSRGGLKTGGTLGKGRDYRVANSKQLKWEPNSQKTLDEIAAMKKTKTVKINSQSNLKKK